MRQKGVTLIELLIIISVIGILAALIIPSFLEMNERAKENSSSTFDDPKVVKTNGESDEIIRGKVRMVYAIVIIEGFDGNYYQVGEKYELTDFSDIPPIIDDKVTVFRIDDRLSVKVIDRVKPLTEEKTTNQKHDPPNRGKQ